MAYSKIKKDGTPSKKAGPIRPAHRPVKVNEEDFTRIVNEYIKHCEDSKLIPLRQELALMLGVDTDTVNRYSKKPRYAAVLKRVDKLSELGWLRYAEATNKPIFPIFMLKAQHGYIEQQRLDVTSGGHLLGTIQLPKR